jgi:ParB family chromosome partitioning protein
MTDSKPERRGLGRGLSALMADVNIPSAAEPEAAAEPRRRSPDSIVPIERVHPNPDQPRRDFAKEELDELAASIREHGIIQPLIVRADPGRGGEYQIVAGERRWRAAQIAGLHDVPVLIRELNDTEVIEVAIIENIQRANLNAVEEAQAYRQLMDRFGHTQEKLAEGLGKSRSHIANLLRLLTLPDDVQALLREGKLTAGHARALVTADAPGDLARKIVSGGLSVRQAEKLAKRPSVKRESVSKTNVQKDADTKALEQDLTNNIGMHVAIDHDPDTQGGRITITYESLDELDELCRILSFIPQDATR